MPFVLRFVLIMFFVVFEVFIAIAVFSIFPLFLSSRASGRLPGALRELPGGSREAPRKLPGGSREAPGRVRGRVHGPGPEKASIWVSF